MTAAYEDYLASYVPVLAILLIGAAFFTVAVLANRLLRPTRPTHAKLTTYECGLDPVGTGWAQVHVRYYVFAYLYVVFAVDVIYLFPWATVFEGFGWVTVGEMGVFIGVLAAGLAYAWRTGVLTWT